MCLQDTSLAWACVGRKPCRNVDTSRTVAWEATNGVCCSKNRARRASVLEQSLAVQEFLLARAVVLMYSHVQLDSSAL